MNSFCTASRFYKTNIRVSWNLPVLFDITISFSWNDFTLVYACYSVHFRWAKSLLWSIPEVFFFLLFIYLFFIFWSIYWNISCNWRSNENYAWSARFVEMCLSTFQTFFPWIRTTPRFWIGHEILRLFQLCGIHLSPCSHRSQSCRFPCVAVFVTGRDLCCFTFRLFEGNRQFKHRT